MLLLYTAFMQNYPTIPIQAIKGRGAASRIAHRFALDARETFDDGWREPQSDEDEEKTSIKTEVRFEDAKSALTKNDSPDLPFQLTLNPYRGCEHGCIYCFARPTHSYLGLSPGLDFETKLIAKPNIAAVLARELQRPTHQPQVINVGGATDCYQPIERALKLTRACIEVFAKTNHPFTLVTKSSLVERDLDLLVPLAQKNLVAIFVTITTLDPHLARTLEPRAAAPHRRLRVIETLAKAGVPVGVSVSPQIPFINDDMEQVLEAAHAAGAHHAFYTVIRLPWEVAPLFKEWLVVHYPDRAARVMARIADMRGGREYDSNFATRMKGSGLWADLIQSRFAKAMQRHGYKHPSLVFNTTDFDASVLGAQAKLF
jgi:DNA repair photolyase